MFFRVKKIKGKEYAYAVENEWKRNGSRQKVKGYLGRAYRFELKNNIGFVQFKKIENAEIYIKENEFKKIIRDLIAWELFKNDVGKDKFTIDLDGMKVRQNKKNVVLLMNEGFMCNLTLKNIFEFKPEGDESNDGYKLARAFVEAGIKVPQEIFVGLFGKLFKTSA